MVRSLHLIDFTAILGYTSRAIQFGSGGCRSGEVFMDAPDIFVSVGSTATKKQEDFVHAVEERLRVEGLLPHTIG